MASVEQDVQQLMQPMLKKLLFVVIARVTGTQEEMKPHVAEHLEWMNRMEAEGKLFASGPFPEDGVEVGDGLTIFSVGSYEEAKRLIEDEPMTKRGFRTYELRPWELREGRMMVTLSASTSTYTL